MSKTRKGRPLIAVMAAGLALLSVARARADGPETTGDNTTVSPYIDSVKKEMSDQDKPTANPPADSSVPDPFIQAQKKKLKNPSEPNGDYIDQLRKENPSLNPKAAEPQSYTQKLKEGLPDKTQGGAIQAVKEGHSDLHEKRTGEIKSAAGFRVGAGMSYSLSAPSIGTTESFTDIYGSGWHPDFSFFYEYQFLRSETWGSLGVLANLELLFAKGNGIFAKQLDNPVNGQQFPIVSGTTFQIFMLPVTLGLSYRLNIAKYIRPFAQGGASVIGFAENRSDNNTVNKVTEGGFYASAGVNILLDWVSKAASWNLYELNGVQHLYLTVELMHLSNLGGPISVNDTGIDAGFTVEF